MAEERMAFMVCDSDRMMGLNWQEVKSCEERFAALLDAQNIPIPSKADFESADLNEDGTLLFEEWQQWVEGADEDLVYTC